MVPAAGCILPESRAPLIVQREAWSFGPFPGWILRTPNYEIRTTTKDSIVLDVVPRLLEGALEAYQELLPSQNPPAELLQTYLFADRGQWEAYTKWLTGPRAQTYLRIRTGGYEENGVTVSHYSRRGPTLSVMAHEGLHQYLTMTGRRRIPAWLNEGLATQFEAFTFDRAGWPIFSTRRNYRRRKSLRQALREDRLIPLQELLNTDAGSAIRGGGKQASAFYAQVWSLVLYLREASSQQPEAEGFRRLLADLGSPRMVALSQRYRSAASAVDGTVMTLEEAVFRQYITHDLNALESRYLEFARKLAE
ncbi:MAG: DUF1570 domain-containing protein [Phycisphaerae bacterium]